ncbi:MAG: sporulation protein YqfD [Lachnospiraceae bacterium]|nr:sporulation protein YqfD [Lachnospiraceae bacterium]
MEQRFINFFLGYVRIRIMGTSYDRFLNICAFNGIRLWNLLPAENSYEAFVSRKDFWRLKEIVRKSHTRIRVVGRYGFPFFVHRYRARGASLAGAFAAVLLMAWLSAHVWNISIEGNLSQTDDVIFEYLQQEGVSHGMWKNQVDTSLLGDQLRNYFTQFSWVSCELEGTHLTIYVKEGEGITDSKSGEEISGSQSEKEISDSQSAEENSDSQTGAELSGLQKEAGTSGSQEEADPEAEEMQAGQEEVLTGIAASKSGTVISIYVRKGQAAVLAGDSVEEGALLVSGQIPIYNDDGEIIDVREVAADADILLRTETSYFEELFFETEQKSYTGHQKERFSLRICDAVFSLSGRLLAFSLCDVTEKITQIKISDNFYLPVYLHKYTASEYEVLRYMRSEDQVKEILEENLEIFIKELQEKGVQIFENNVKIDLYDQSAIAEGTLITGESAVRRVAESVDEDSVSEE